MSTKVHSLCAWSNSEIGYSSCSLIGNNYEKGCIHVREIWSQTVPLLLAINVPFLKENSYTDACND